MNEKKACIYNIQRFSIHDGPGIRTTFFFKGCPLHCPWCSNPESQRPEPEPMWDNIKKHDAMVGHYYTVPELLSIAKKDRNYYEESNGGVTFSGGEVLAQNDFVVEFAKACQAEKLHTACETSGFASQEHFAALLEHIDLLMMDIKHHNTAVHKEKTGVSLNQILLNLELARSSSKEILIRIPIIPGFNDTAADAASFGRLLSRYSVTKAELLPFHQFGKNKYKYLNRAYELEGVKQLTSESLRPQAEILESYNIACLISE